MLWPLIDKTEIDAAGEKGHFAEASHQRLPLIIQGLQDGVIGQEGLDGAGFVGRTFTDDLHIGDGNAPFKALTMNLTVTLDDRFHPTAQRIDCAHADAMQTAGNFIAATAKFTPGAQFGHDHRNSGHARLFLNVHGDAGAIIFDGDTVIFMDHYANPVTTPLHGLVNRVVHHFDDHVVERLYIGAAHIHTRALADML